jgi:VWFA-related protein
LRLAGSGLFARALAFCFAASLCTWAGSQTLPPARKEAALPYAPTPPSRSAAGKDTAAQSLIRLELVVTDKSGKLVTGLEPRDFTLMDNGQPSKILSLRAFNGNSAKPDQPVEVILVIDTIALPDRLASYEKQEVERFLRQNGGRLAHPVSIFWLSDAGLSTLAQPSADGSFLAEEMVHNKQLALTRRALRNTQIGEPLDSLTFDDPPGLTALKALGEIATSERTKPGRMLLLWVGPGWGMGSGKHYFSKLTREQLFEAINWFSTLMREARLVLYSFSVGEADGFNLTMDSGITPPRGLYQDFLKGVKSDREASVDALDRKVLAVQSGGRVLEPADDLRSDILHTGLTDRTPEFDLVKQINSCVEEADDFYALSFNPVDTKQTDEYHDLKVEVDKPGLVVRTKTATTISRTSTIDLSRRPEASRSSSCTRCWKGPAASAMRIWPARFLTWN